MKNCQVWRSAPRRPSVRKTCQARAKKSAVRMWERAKAIPMRRTRRNAAAANPRCRCRYFTVGSTDPTCVSSRSMVLSSTASHKLHLVSGGSIPATRPRPPVHDGRLRGGFEKQLLLEPVTYPIERFDHIERVFGLLELFPQPFDMAIDRAVVYVNLVIVGGIHQGVTTFDHTRPGGQ